MLELLVPVVQHPKFFCHSLGQLRELKDPENTMSPGKIEKQLLGHLTSTGIQLTNGSRLPPHSVVFLVHVSMQSLEVEVHWTPLSLKKC